MNEKNFESKNSSSENDVIEFYDNYAKNWDVRFANSLSNNHFLDQRFESFKRLIESEKNLNTALELGVGTGVYIDRTHLLFKKIIAVDGSPEMLNIFKVRLKFNNINNVICLNSNVISMDSIENESIDCVYFFGVLEHIIQINKFLLEIKRVLKKGGIIIGVTPNGKSPWYIFRKLVRGTDKHCLTDKYYTDAEIDRIFSQYGFTCKNIFFWGGVPSGIDNIVIFKLLCAFEKVLMKTPLKKFLGGLSFKYEKMGHDLT